MDVSNRLLHVYGKSPAGAAVLRSSRDTLPSLARRILILIDGKRTLGELAAIFPHDALETSLALLEEQGLVECLRHFPQAADGFADSRFFAPLEAPGALPAARRRSTQPIVFAGLAALVGAGFYLAGGVASAPPPTADPAAPSAGASESAAVPAIVTGSGNAAAPLAPGAAPAPRAAPPVARVSPPPASAAPAAPASAPTSASAPASAPAPAPAPATARAAPPPAARSPGRLALAPVPAIAALAPVPFRKLTVRRQITPLLPKAARDMGITSGRVVVVLQVNPGGTVDHVDLVSATPPQVYDEDMQMAFEEWTFEPLGIPGRMTVEVLVGGGRPAPAPAGAAP